MGAIFPNTQFVQIASDSDLTPAKLERIRDEKPDRVQVDLGRARVSPRGWQALDAGLFQADPTLTLRLYGGGQLNTKFLENLPNVVNLSVECKTFLDGASLASMTRLERFTLVTDRLENGLGFLETRAKTLSHFALARNSSAKLNVDLSVLSGLPKLQSLGLDGHAKSLPALVPTLKQLEKLVLRSTGPLRDLSFLQANRKLTKLQLKTCGAEDYSALSGLTQLKCLELYKPTKLARLDVISDMSGLQLLQLQTVNAPTVFPDLRRLTRLRRVVLNALQSIRDFSAFSKTKSVEEFAFYDIKSQRPEDFRPVLENPSIKRVYLWSLKPSYRKELGVTLNTYSRRVEKVNYLSDSDFAYR